jgi:hypothetical protein
LKVSQNHDFSPLVTEIGKAKKVLFWDTDRLAQS